MKIHARSLNTHKDKKRVTLVYDPDGRSSVTSARVIGSWDKDGRFRDSWDQSAQVMRPREDGTFAADLYLDASHPGDWRWGVMADGPAGEDRWAVMQENDLTFRLDEGDGQHTYAPSTISQNGAVRQGEDLKFRYWAPHARSVQAVLWTPDSQVNRTVVPMTKDAKGKWQTNLEGGWKRHEGHLYAYEVTDSEGEVSLRVDPYARQRMGPQRGVDDLYLHATTGQEVHKFHPDRTPFTRFEVQEYPGLESVRLVLSDPQGKDLTAEDLRKRFQHDEGAALVARYHDGGTSDHWSQRLKSDGTIELLPQGKAFATILPPAELLKGLHYRFEGFDASGKLLGDLNSNQRLEPGEARALAFNDPYSSELDGKHRWQRFGIVEQEQFDWKHDKAPRLAQHPNEQVIYQIHPGSIFGQGKNVDRTSFDDIMKRLDYFKDLGVNALELMPVNSFEGSRDWGYIGSHNMAISENYGFVNDKGDWVQGDRALKQFVDAAHEKGFRVYNDVVYNHFGGDFNNVWNVGGKENPWFEWDSNPEKPGDSIKHTPWGALPAYNKEAVEEFITNHALHQLDEFHFDGLRFDFTHPIHAQGDHGGGDHGWEMLQKINRTIDFFHPEAFVAAEEFPNHPVVVTPPHAGRDGGAGFDAMWNTEFQHRLVHDHGNPAVLQEAAHGAHTRIDKLMHHLLSQPGFKGASSSVTVVSNHDEVGNADRTLNVANNHKPPTSAGPWERSVARTVMGVGLLSPGMPIFFQGDESLATNKFSWGIPSNWDVGWEWMNDPESPRYKHHAFTKAVLAMRGSSEAFDADSEAHRVYTHELDSVMAFSRKRGEDEFLVVASFNKERLEDYKIPVEGAWELVLNSDETRFGGEGLSVEQRLDRDTGVTLPPGGVLVFKAKS